MARVLLTRAEATEDSDPVVGKFLAFLARDMEAQPTQIRKRCSRPDAPCPIAREGRQS